MIVKYSIITKEKYFFIPQAISTFLEEKAFKTYR